MRLPSTLSWRREAPASAARGVEAPGAARAANGAGEGAQAHAAANGAAAAAATAGKAAAPAPADAPAAPAGSVVVRTIATSLQLGPGDVADAQGLDAAVGEARAFLGKAEAALLAAPRRDGGESLVREVQTTRVSCNPIEEWLGCGIEAPEEAVERVSALAEALDAHGVTFANLGPVRELRNIPLVPRLLKCSKSLNMSAAIGGAEAGALNPEKAALLARVVRDLAAMSPDGADNFRFCVASNVASGAPFFPASYFDRDPDGRRHFSVGLETSELLLRAFEAAVELHGDDAHGSLLRACEEMLTDEYVQVLEPLAAACEALAKETGAVFDGIDASMNPSLSPRGIGHAFKAVLERVSGGGSHFGSSGTMALSYVITKSIRQAAEACGARLCGYSGLMLPHLEDEGLAEAAAQDKFTVHDLLMCSAVCGVGVDTVPLPGDIPESKLASLLLDVQALSQRWTKPLSCRVLLVPGKAVGERCEFENPFLCNSVVLGLK